MFLKQQVDIKDVVNHVKMNLFCEHRLHEGFSRTAWTRYRARYKFSKLFFAIFEDGLGELIGEEEKKEEEKKDGAYQFFLK